MNRNKIDWNPHLYDRVSLPRIEPGLHLIQNLNIYQQDDILDVGCGTGSLTLELSKYSNGNIVGIDISQEMLEQASSKLQNGSAKNVCFKLKDIMGYDDIKNKFDVIFSNSTLQWVNKQSLLFGKFYKLLKPNGRLGVQIPSKEFCPIFTEALRYAKNHQSLKRYFTSFVSPWRLLTKDDYLKILVPIGFKDVKVESKTFTYGYSSEDEIINFFKGGGLQPFIKKLPADKEDFFLNLLKTIFKQHKTSHRIYVAFNRLFIFAFK